MNEHSRICRHLDNDYSSAVRDSLWGHIYLTPAFEKLCATREFRQLSKVRQLGPTHLVYPGAVHTRLNHSLGVFHLAHGLIRRLAGFPDAPDLSMEGVRAFLAAALLHDLGHFPFTHSLKELPLLEHEQLTARVICDGELSELLRRQLDCEPAFVAAIVDESADYPLTNELQLYRRLLSGTLDPDKLDYLNRDAYFCGVPYGVQDIDFVLDRIRPNGYAGVALDRSGISAVENILFSKYLMYRAVYWHKSVRVATAMIKTALHRALNDDILQPEQLYGLDDHSFTASFTKSRHPAYTLIEAVDHGDLFRAVLELPFEAENPVHNRLCDLGSRAEIEQHCCEWLRSELKTPLASHEVIVDLPEAVKFEVAFPIRDHDSVIEYLDAGSVFTPEVVSTFTRNLRQIRLILPVEIAERLSPQQTSELRVQILG